MIYFWIGGFLMGVCAEGLLERHILNDLWRNK